MKTVEIKNPDELYDFFDKNISYFHFHASSGFISNVYEMLKTNRQHDLAITDPLYEAENKAKKSIIDNIWTMIPHLDYPITFKLKSSVPFSEDKFIQSVQSDSFYYPFEEGIMLSIDNLIDIRDNLKVGGSIVLKEVGFSYLNRLLHEEQLEIIDRIKEKVQTFNKKKSTLKKQLEHYKSKFQEDEVIQVGISSYEEFRDLFSLANFRDPHIFKRDSQYKHPANQTSSFLNDLINQVGQFDKRFDTGFTEYPEDFIQNLLHTVKEIQEKEENMIGYFLGYKPRLGKYIKIIFEDIEEKKTKLKIHLYFSEAHAIKNRDALLSFLHHSDFSDNYYTSAKNFKQTYASLHSYVNNMQTEDKDLLESMKEVFGVFRKRVDKFYGDIGDYEPTIQEAFEKVESGTYSQKKSRLKKSLESYKTQFQESYIVHPSSPEAFLRFYSAYLTGSRNVVTELIWQSNKLNLITDQDEELLTSIEMKIKSIENEMMEFFHEKSVIDEIYNLEYPITVAIGDKIGELYYPDVKPILNAKNKLDLIKIFEAQIFKRGLRSSFINFNLLIKYIIYSKRDVPWKITEIINDYDQEFKKLQDQFYIEFQNIIKSNFSKRKQNLKKSLESNQIYRSVYETES